MTRTHHWGSTINPALFAEDGAGHAVTANDSAVVRVVGRPAEGTHVTVKLLDLSDQADIVLGKEGRWSYQLDLPDTVLGGIYIAGLDPNGNPASIGPIYSLEAMQDMVAAAAGVAQAQVAATAAQASAANALTAASSAAGAAQAAQAAAEASTYPGYVDWNNVRTPPAITGRPLTDFAQEVLQVGSSYPTPNAQFRIHRFTGTASPVTQGIMVHGDRWTQVLVP